MFCTPPRLETFRRRGAAHQWIGKGKPGQESILTGAEKHPESAAGLIAGCAKGPGSPGRSSLPVGSLKENCLFETTRLYPFVQFFLLTVA